MRREYLRDRLTQPFFANEWPTWADLSQGRVVAPNQVSGAVTSRLSRFRHCVMTALEGRGKTSLARYFGYLALLADRTVYHIDFSRAGSDTVDQVCLAIESFDSQGPLYLIEDVHECEDPDILRRIVAASVQSSHSEFLYTERGAEIESIFDHLEFAIGGLAVTRVDLEVRLQPTADLVRAIIERRVQTASGLVMPTPKGCDVIAAKIGGNLRILSAYLDCWDSGPLSAVPEERVLRTVYTRRLANVATDTRRTLVQMSAIGQFGIPVRGDLFEPSHVSTLERERLVIPFGLDRYFRFAHASDAAMNILAWAVVNEQDPEAITREGVKAYLTSSPRPRYCERLLGRLRIQQQAQPLLSLWKSATTGAAVLEPATEPGARRRELVPEHFVSLLRAEGVENSIVAGFQESLESAPLSYIRSRLGGVEGSALEATLRQAIVKQGAQFLVKKIRSADEEDASWALRYFQRASPQLTTKVRRSLTSEDWREIWLRTPLPKLITFLYGRYAREPELHEHTEMAREVLLEIARAANFGERLRRLSFEKVGKMLALIRRIDGDGGELLAGRVAAELDVSACREPEKLTLVLKELWELGGEATRDQLLAQITTKLPIQVFVDETSGRGLAFLMFNLMSAADDEGRRVSATRMLRAVLSSSGLDAKVSEWDPIALRTFLWSGLILNRTDTARWLRTARTSVISVLGRASVTECFSILWNVAQLSLDEAKAIASISQESFQARFWAGARVEPPALPLLGLYVWLWPVEILKVLPVQDVTTSAVALCKRAHGSDLVFALNCYTILWPHMAGRFAEAVRAHWSAKNDLTLEQSLLSHPLPDIVDIFVGILRQFPVFVAALEQVRAPDEPSGRSN